MSPWWAEARAARCGKVSPMKPLDPTILDEVAAAAGGARTLSIDRFAELCAPHDLDAEAIDALIGGLEARGCFVEGDPDASPREELRVVLVTARRFVGEHGRRPSPSEISAHSGLDVAVVRRALVYGRILGR